MSAKLFYVPVSAILYRGLPQAGAKVTFYLTGTTTKTPIYTAADMLTPASNPVVSDGAGQLPAIYLDSTVIYRIVITDSTGAVLIDRDPCLPGEVAGTQDAVAAALNAIAAYPLTVTSATGQSVTTRGLLAGITSPINGQTARLTETNRVGVFQFSTANLSTQVTADTGQALYVAPTAAPTGASGAWVRTSNDTLRTVYASAIGAALDSNLTSGGGTDDTAVIQAALNLASGGTPLHLIVDGPCLVGALNVYGNTTIECIAGGGFYLKNSTNRALLRNAHPLGSGAVTDKNIYLLNCTFNGNYANQTGTGMYSRREANGTLIGLVQLYGVDNVKVHGCKFIKSKSIAIHFSNATNVDISDAYFDNNVVGEQQQNGVQFEGPCSALTLRGIRGSTGDDMIALSSDGGSYVETPFTGLGPYVSTGDITDVHISGVVGLGNTLSALRIFNSTHLVDRVTLDGVTGTFCTALFWNEPAGLTPGNIGTLSLLNISVQMLRYTGITTFRSGCAFYGTIDNLIMRNVVFHNPVDDRGHFYFDGTCVIKMLDADGLAVYEQTQDWGPTVMVYYTSGCHIVRAQYRNITWRRNTTFARVGKFFYVNPTAQIDDHSVDGLYANRVNDIYYKDGATTTSRVTFRNVSHIDAASSSNALVKQVGGTITTLDVSGWYADVAGRVSGGTITNKLGTAFINTTTIPLTAGVLTIAYPDTTANTVVIATTHTDGGTPGVRYAVQRNVGTSIVIAAKDASNATQTLDTSTLDILIKDL